MKWIVSIGAIFALCTSLLGAMFPLPRVLYAMAEDGILYKVLRRVHPKTKTPLIATMLSGLLAAIMALIFNLQQLVDMMSIGTLLAYTIVAICVIVLRYQNDEDVKEPESTSSQVIRQILNSNLLKQPTKLSSNIAKTAVVLYCLACVILCSLLESFDGQSYAWIVCTVVTVVALILLTLVMARQPSGDIDLTFKVPLVPLLPCLSILINMYLMAQLDMHTWIRFIVWILIGYAIYFTYGIRFSVEGDRRLSNATKSNANNMQSLQSINMDFVNNSTLTLTETNTKGSKF